MAKKATKKAATNRMSLKNGVEIIYAPSAKRIIRKGLVYVHAIAVQGKDKAPITIVYNETDGIVVRVTAEKAAGRELAALALVGIKQTSGTWKNMTIKREVKTTLWVRPSRYTPARKNKAHVYFWKRRVLDENREVIAYRYCHSGKLIASDPMGDKLFALWTADPEGFMIAHPELCRGRA